MVIKKVVTAEVYKKALENGNVDSLFFDSKFLDVAVSKVGHNKVFKNVEFKNCKFDGYFYACKFQHVIFKNCTLLDESDFVSCEFTECKKILCNF